MKRALLDINVLISLLDRDHVHHVRARRWLESNVAGGWASCPLTQNGCIRVMSQPRYTNPLPTAAVIEHVATATQHEAHEFWPDDISVLSRETFDTNRINGPRQLTDVYLLALAVRHGGRFATFDRAVPIDAVHDATPEDLVVI